MEDIITTLQKAKSDAQASLKQWQDTEASLKTGSNAGLHIHCLTTTSILYKTTPCIDYRSKLKEATDNIKKYQDRIIEIDKEIENQTKIKEVQGNEYGMPVGGISQKTKSFFEKNKNVIFIVAGIIVIYIIIKISK